MADRVRWSIACTDLSARPLLDLHFIQPMLSTAQADQDAHHHGLAGARQQHLRIALICFRVQRERQVLSGLYDHLIDTGCGRSPLTVDVAFNCRRRERYATLFVRALHLTRPRK